ncbi:MAG: NAD-dependent epimerase/dehydratase family protein [Methanomassiliicoccales archaeon]|nr:NAD-dependent epimerase/dehydratase family protein [Methanomassiliicoccales archaeon]
MSSTETDGKSKSQTSRGRSPATRDRIVDEDIQFICSSCRSELNQLKGKRLMITGGTGFVGRYLVESVLEFSSKSRNRCHILLPVRDPRKARCMFGERLEAGDIVLVQWHEVGSSLAQEERCDYIIHAASPSDPREYLKDPKKTIEQIVDLTQSIVDYAVSADSRRLLYVSSGAVYGKVPTGLDRIPEDYPGAPDPTSPSSCYGEAKRFSEMLCSTSGVETAIARLFSFIGPYQDPNSSFAAPDFINQALTKRRIVVRGDGTSVRSYCYSSELCITLWKLLLGKRAHVVYNVGMDSPTITIEELAKLVADVVGNTKVEVLGAKPARATKEPPNRYVPDISRLRDIYEPKIGVREAVERTVAHCQGTGYAGLCH